MASLIPRKEPKKDIDKKLLRDINYAASQRQKEKITGDIYGAIEKNVGKYNWESVSCTTLVEDIVHAQTGKRPPFYPFRSLTHKQTISSLKRMWINVENFLDLALEDAGMTRILKRRGVLIKDTEELLPGDVLFVKGEINLPNDYVYKETVGIMTAVDMTNNLLLHTDDGLLTFDPYGIKTYGHWRAL